MKARSAAVQGGLAIAGLIAAYVTWQRPKDTGKVESTVIVEASKSSLERVSYTDGVRSVSVDKKDRLLVTLAFLPGKRPAPDAGVEAVDGGPMVSMVPLEPPPDRTVYANDRADTLWSRLTPFEATRALGKLSPQKLDEVGLSQSERKLELQVAGVTHRFTISRPVSGLIGNYAQDEKSGEVFLIASSLFNELDPNSQLLVDRRLHLFKAPDFDSLALKAGGKTATFVQPPAEHGQPPKLARAETPDTAEELARNWHEKIWNRLIVTEVLSQNENPKTGAPEVLLRLDYSQKGKPKGWLEMGIDSNKATWVRSENTPSWVAVHQGSEETILEGKKLIK